MIITNCYDFFKSIIYFRFSFQHIATILKKWQTEKLHYKIEINSSMDLIIEDVVTSLDFEMDNKYLPNTL